KEICWREAYESLKGYFGITIRRDGMPCPYRTENGRTSCNAQNRIAATGAVKMYLKATADTVQIVNKAYTDAGAKGLKF
ncbi:MAG: hypothetical protein D3913_16670, partial [Candidatus Electrothrix sp. LOE1_4_5]|nr:hypothetical protein [Candidatus Electrothrix gigas]